jgi:hypothetical protein
LMPTVRPGLLLAVLFSTAVLMAAVAETDPAESIVLPACAAKTTAPAVDTNGATGTVLIYVGLRNRSGHACRARGRATLALRDAKTHALLHIYANPYARTVRRSLRRGLNNLFTMQWKNYCGPGRPLLIVASFARRQAVEREAYAGARCELPDVPSELRLVHLPR